jgi:hypothetical protein
MGDFEAITASDDATVWRRLYESCWPIILQEEVKRSRPGADVRAAKRAADLVEQIRLSTGKVVRELTMSSIEQDASPEELRQRIISSVAFHPSRGLMLARKTLGGVKAAAATREWVY